MSIITHIQNIVATIASPSPTFSFADDPRFNVIAPNTDFSNSHVRLREIEEGGITVTAAGGHKDDYTVFLHFLMLANPENTIAQHFTAADSMRPLVSSFIKKYNEYRQQGQLVFEEIEQVKVTTILNQYAEGLNGFEVKFTCKLNQARPIC